jgi:hypothetical protein
VTQEFRTWRARLDSCHDGDTIRLVVDTGFDTTCRKWMRLRRVFAPELTQRGGTSTRTFTARYLDAGVGAWPLEVDTYRTSGDNDVTTLDRYVAEVRLAATGASLNDAVIAFLAQHPTWQHGIGTPTVD